MNVISSARPGARPSAGDVRWAESRDRCCASIPECTLSGRSDDAQKILPQRLDRMLAGVAGTTSRSRWDDDLLALIRATDHLCLDVDNPGWENARGYLFDEPAMTLYFPVAKKYLTPPLSQYEVIIWSQPRVVVRGELQPATSEQDAAMQLSLALGARMDANKARYMLLDQRTQKPRRTRYKLIVRDIARADARVGMT